MWLFSLGAKLDSSYRTFLVWRKKCRTPSFAGLAFLWTFSPRPKCRTLGEAHPASQKFQNNEFIKSCRRGIITKWMPGKESLSAGLSFTQVVPKWPHRAAWEKLLTRKSYRIYLSLGFCSFGLNECSLGTWLPLTIFSVSPPTHPLMGEGLIQAQPRRIMLRVHRVHSKYLSLAINSLAALGKMILERGYMLMTAAVLTKHSLLWQNSSGCEDDLKVRSGRGCLLYPASIFPLKIISPATLS